MLLGVRNMQLVSLPVYVLVRVCLWVCWCVPTSPGHLSCSASPPASSLSPSPPGRTGPWPRGGRGAPQSTPHRRRGAARLLPPQRLLLPPLWLLDWLAPPWWASGTCPCGGKPHSVGSLTRIPPRSGELLRHITTRLSVWPAWGEVSLALTKYLKKMYYYCLLLSLY